MKRLFPVFLLFCFQIAKGQTITAKVIDASTNRPLSYAIILFQFQQRVVYTDPNGYFSLSVDSLNQRDSIIVQYLGYRKLSVDVSNLKDGMVLKMIPEMLSLQPVTVSSCRSTDEHTLNKKIGNIKQYIGPGPETRLVIISRYNNIYGTRGYVKKVSILIDEKAPTRHVPVRLHWYEWNTDAKMPGDELTDTNLLVYPYKKGWNDFEIPDYLIPLPPDWIVFGLEFIYIPEYKKHFDTLKSSQEKLQWLNDIKNRWSLGMQYVRDENETGFYIINNGAITRYNKKYDRYFIRPAIKFTIKVCKE
jgi:CarboxypepD_reg-like domain